MTPSKSRYCVIMCGGIGSRFWPFSRNEMPKQFIDFLGTGRSLLQMTVDRVRPLVPPENILLVTNLRYASIIQEQLPDIPARNILAEPARRNTAPCICWAANHILARDPEASIMTLPSDHLVLKEEAFVKAMDEGMSFVEQNDALLTLGIMPTSPQTGYGYIQKGTPLADWPGIMKVKSFTEKPDIEMARFFLKSGEFFWNSGIFLWKASSILVAFDKHDPKTAAVFAPGKTLFNTPQEENFIANAFPSAPSISIDYAIMEKADNVFVKTVDLGWSDLGNWSALYETSERDENGNVTRNCNVLARDCHNSIFAVKGDKIIVAHDLDNFIVADTPNALLICPIDKEQLIRHDVMDISDNFGDKYL
ncbi:MAG: mannose-1-phosphate guanylyltransferase [Bacteroidales bacterium]|nr:mannose-1-phosphate guanylyltransferase [Bacteroidales bacterium]